MAIKLTQLNTFQSYGTYTTYISIKQTSDAFLVVNSTYRFSYFAYILEGVANYP